MGTVQLAVRREGTFARVFAIKRLHPHLREDAEVRAMFLDEARIAGLLAHPNLVSVIDVGEDADGPFLVMDYVEGVSVAEIIQRASANAAEVPLAFALHIGMQAAEGLHAAHELVGLDGQRLGLVHRDISPHNILVGFDGLARVTDFGIARALGRSQKTSTGILKGKLGYMSPEQLSFEAQDQRSDLFSFGVTLFELLTAQRLYPNGDGPQSARRILHEPPPDIADYRDDAPPELAELLFRLMAKDPAHRPQNAREVAQVLGRMLKEQAELLGEFDVAEHLQREFEEERRRVQEETRAAVRASEHREQPTTPPPRRRPAEKAPSQQRGDATSSAVWPRPKQTRGRRWAPFAAGSALVVGLAAWLSWQTTGATSSGVERQPASMTVVGSSAGREPSPQREPGTPSEPSTNAGSASAPIVSVAQSPPSEARLTGAPAEYSVTGPIPTAPPSAPPRAPGRTSRPPGSSAKVARPPQPRPAPAASKPSGGVEIWKW